MTQQDEIIARLTQELRAREAEVAKLRASNSRLADTLGNERVAYASVRDELASLEDEIARIDGLRDLNARSSRAWKRLAKRLRGQHANVLAAHGAALDKCREWMRNAGESHERFASADIALVAAQNRIDALESQLVAWKSAHCSAEERIAELENEMHEALRERDDARMRIANLEVMLRRAEPAESASERKPPFAWTEADKTKLVPGATLLCSAGERCTYLHDDVQAYGYLRLHDTEHDIRFSEAREDVDPASIKPPAAGFDANGSDAT